MKLEASATTQITDNLSKFNTIESICLSTAHIWHSCFSLGVFGRPEFHAASVSVTGPPSICKRFENKRSLSGYQLSFMTSEKLD